MGELVLRWCSLLMAAPNTFCGHPFPSFANEEAVNYFRGIEMRDDDVCMVSFPKAGTTWVNKILYMMLRTDEDGVPLPGLPERDMGASGQVYPDWLAVGTEPKPIGPGGMMGAWCTADLLNQPTPRLISTHSPAALLPEELKVRGRLVYVIRNPKDCLNSLHYFRGVAKDGWSGNENGPGSMARFLSGVNAYGSYFDHVATMDDYIQEHLKDRALVVYYEELKEDISTQLTRIASFLGVPLNQTRLEVIRNETDIRTMASKKDSISSVLIRKGINKDWESADVSAEQWAELDKVFEASIGRRAIAEPMRVYMEASRPASLAEKVEAMIRASVSGITHFEIVDESGCCGAKFNLILVAEGFEGVGLLDRQRLVNASLKDVMDDIHALSMKTWTPAQYEKKKAAGAVT